MKHLRSVLQILMVGSLLISRETIPAQAPKAPDPTEIEFATLDEALKALRAKAGVKFRNEGGWLVAEDSAVFTVWLLTPADHPAYPSMVKRTLVNKPDGAYFETNIRCLAKKDVCDKFFASK